MRNIVLPAICGTALSCLALTTAFSQPWVKPLPPNTHPYLVGNPTGSAETFQPDLLPQSPEAEAMVKNTLLPVTLYSGMADVSVPLYDLKGRSLDVPISLSYNYNGFKPTEVASYAGLGWSVQGSGVITRIVKSRVDHQDPHVTGNDYDNYININLITGKQTVLQNTALGMVDGEPDIYVFNCNGMSGKFILLKGQAYMLPYQKVNVSGDGNGAFTLTNEKGDQYVFGATETRHHHQLRGTDYVPDHVSAWYLSKVISADGVDTINYSYSSYTYTAPPVYSEIYTATVPAGSSIAQNSMQTLIDVASSGDYIYSQQLSSITYKNTSILFGLDASARADIGNNDGSIHALSSVSIVNSGSTNFSKHITLQHQYVNGNLSLTEVDITGARGDLGIDSSTLQRYQFQYIGTYGAGAPGNFSTHSIDLFGYANGGNNTTLFTTADNPGSSFPKADRTPSPSYSQLGMLSQMTYPTGGYVTFAYEQNQTGHYIVTGQYYNVYSADTVTIKWAGTDPGPPSGYYQNSTSFSINQKQPIKIALSVNTPAPLTDTILRLENVATGAVVFMIGQVPAEIISDTLYMEDSLAVGAYNLFVYVNKKGATVTATPVFYNTYPIIYNTLGPAPGLRVKTISHFDNTSAATPALVKQYSYQEGVGFFKDGTTSATLYQHGSDCSNNSIPLPDLQIITLQAGLYASSSDLNNNEFYYQTVEETDIGPTNNGKTDYYYGCYAPDEPNVFLTQQIQYGYNGTDYYPLHRTINNYQLHDKYTFQTYTANLTDDLPPAGTYCSGIPTPDQTQPVPYLPLVYGAIHGSLPQGYKLLTSTIDSSWDMNGENPMRSETDYTYGNPDYLYPTKITRTDSKGQLNSTYFKYALDYPVRSTLTLASQDSAFTSWENNCVNGYNMCDDSLISALQPYQPYLTNSTTFTQIANSFHCETEYQGNSGLVFSARNSQRTAYLASVDSAGSADPVTWHRALYWMQANNLFSPVIEQYSTVTKGDGNEYLLSATRNDYSLVASAAGGTFAKQTEMEAVELNSPMLYSSFLANTSAYYKPQVYRSYDPNMALVTQHQVNNVNYNYLWGYNHLFPVAVVEGSDTATIKAMVNQSVLDNPAGDQALQTELNKVRTGLLGTKALVTTCSYDPMIGITSKTDAAGKTTYYEYDGLGRLVDIKDLNGNIVKTFSYHVVQ